MKKFSVALLADAMYSSEESRLHTYLERHIWEAFMFRFFESLIDS